MQITASQRNPDWGRGEPCTQEHSGNRMFWLNECAYLITNLGRGVVLNTWDPITWEEEVGNQDFQVIASLGYKKERICSHWPASAPNLKVTYNCRRSGPRTVGMGWLRLLPTSTLSQSWEGPLGWGECLGTSCYLEMVPQRSATGERCNVINSDALSWKFRVLVTLPFPFLRQEKKP